MTNEYTTRSYEPGDEGGLVGLLDLVFAPWPDRDLRCNAVEHWRWKYRDNPFGVNMTAMAVGDDKIIGSNHGFNLNIKIGDKTLLCGQSTDLAVHPDYRRMGVATKIGEMKSRLKEDNNVSLIYVITENPIVIKDNVEKHGRPTFPYSLYELMRTKDIRLHLEMTKSTDIFRNQIGYYVIKILNSIGNFFIHRSRLPESEYKISEINVFDDRINEFYDRIKEHFKFIVERSQDYLNWRYCDFRGGDYVVRQFEEGGRVLGYVVLRVNRFKKEYPTGYVVDLLTPPERPDVAEALVSDAVGYFDRQGVNVVRYWIIKNHPYEKTFKKCGSISFWKKAPTIIFNLTNVGDEWNDFINASEDRLHFQMGDTEWL